MNAQEMIEKLARHPIVRGNVGLQMQLGLPWLEKKNGKLCVTFLPHREDHKDGMIVFFTPQYRISWVYPFDRIVFFENRLYSETPEPAKPAQTVSAERYAERGRFLLKELYAQCSDVLAVYERDKGVSDVTVRKYQKAYFEAVQALGLTSVYGEGNG